MIEGNRITRVILASASPARLATLRAAGISPEVQVSGVDETSRPGEGPGQLALRLAELKADAVARPLDPTDTEVPTLVIGCDSVLELDGQAYGKPADAADATARWRQMRGRTGALHTGHAVITADGARWSAVAVTSVHFADIDDDEIEAYVATGEPLQVAGAFTIDGLGGAFVTRIEGDHHNVVGISLPLLRTLVRQAGVPWPSLWAPRSGD